MRYLFTLMFISMFTISAFAAFNGPSSTVSVTTVAQVSKAKDDAPCVLEGNIVERVAGDHEKYMFKDSTGSIVVEIDDKVFKGQEVTPQTKVRLTGKVDKEFIGKDEVDVKILEIIK